MSGNPSSTICAGIYSTICRNFSLSFFSHYSVGRLIVRVINDVNVIRQFLMWAVLAIARDFFTPLPDDCHHVIHESALSLVTFAVLPLMAFITAIFRKRARENYRQTRLAISWVNSVLAENINGVREVQLSPRENVNYGYFKDTTVNQNNLSANLKAARLSSLFYPSIDFLVPSPWQLPSPWAERRSSARISPPASGGIVLYINRFFEPIRDLSQRYDSFNPPWQAGAHLIPVEHYR